MPRLFFILTVLCLTLQSCQSNNTTVESVSSIEDKEMEKLSSPPSQIAENGVCMADTLSFLVGQPETALDAMKYPDNTRILVHGQLVNPGIDPARLNLVLGFDRNIKFVYCG